MARQQRPVTRLQVVAKQPLTPSLLRLGLGGDGLAAFEPNSFTDAYVKLLFEADGSPLLRSLAEGERPVTRTYTVRRVDDEAVWVDFALHAEDGIATQWAQEAQIGDEIQLRGPGGAWAPTPGAWHLFVGDEAALPAIAAGIEALASEAQGIAVIDALHDVPLGEPEGMSVMWLSHEVGEYDPGRLAAAVSQIEFPADIPVKVFAHGERDAMKQLRRLFNERGLAREDVSISGYWAFGRVEDQFQAEKQTDVGKI